MRRRSSSSTAPTTRGCRRSERPARGTPRDVGVPVELEVVPGADHFFDGAPDVEAIFARAVDFLLARDDRIGERSEQ